MFAQFLCLNCIYFLLYAHTIWRRCQMASVYSAHGCQTFIFHYFVHNIDGVHVSLSHLVHSLPLTTLRVSLQISATFASNKISIQWKIDKHRSLWSYLPHGRWQLLCYVLSRILNSYRVHPPINTSAYKTHISNHTQWYTADVKYNVTYK